MPAKKVIVVSKLRRVAVFGSLTRACEMYCFPYHSLKSMPFPFYWNGYCFDKVDYNEGFNHFS